MAVPLSTDERRALAIIAALLILAGGARWLERPRPLLDGVPDLDLAALEQASRDAKPAPRARTGVTPSASATRSAGGTPSAGASGTALRSDGLLDPNHATAQELTTLPGVGPALAARIIEERDREPFRSVADLARVKGIGPALAARLAPAVSLPAQHVDAAAATTPLGLTDAERRAAEADRHAAREAAQRNSPRGQGTAGAGRAAWAAGATGGSGPAATVAVAGAVARLDLNRATAAELERLSGVGPVLAARIVARRDSIGAFRTWDDVDAVSGVGPALLARIRQAAVLEQVP